MWQQQQHQEMKAWLLKRNKQIKPSWFQIYLWVFFCFSVFLIIFYFKIVLENVNMYKISNSYEESNLLYPISFSQKPKQKQKTKGPFGKRFLVMLFKFCGNICGWKSVWKYVLWCLNNNFSCLNTVTKHSQRFKSIAHDEVSSSLTSTCAWLIYLNFKMIFYQSNCLFINY